MHNLLDSITALLYTLYKSHFPLVIVLTLVMFGVACFELGRNDFWTDEAYSWKVTSLSKEPWGDRVHPLGYYTVLDFWVSRVGGSEFALRFPSVVAYALTIPVVYLIGRTVHSPRAGLLAALLFATSPFILQYARNARSYAMLTFVCSAGFLCLSLLLRDRAVQTPIGSSLRCLVRKSWSSSALRRDAIWLGLIATTVFAMTLHYIALSMPILIGATLCAVAATERLHWARLITNVGIFSVAVLALWAVHPHGMGPFLEAFGEEGGRPTPFLFKIAELASLYGTRHFTLALIPMVALSILSLIHWYRTKQWNWLIFVSFLIAPTSFLVIPDQAAVVLLEPLGMNVFWSNRIFIWTTVPFTVMLGIGLCLMRNVALKLVLLAFLLLSNIAGIAMEYEKTRIPYETIMGDIRNQAEDGDVALLSGVGVVRDIHHFTEMYYHNKKGPTVKFQDQNEYEGGSSRLWVITIKDQYAPEAMETLQEYPNIFYKKQYLYGLNKPKWAQDPLPKFLFGYSHDYAHVARLYGATK